MARLEHWSNVHANSPYEGFPLEQYPLNLNGWHSDDPVFEQLIKEVRPQTIVEVGSWLGCSALHLASLLKKHGLGDSRVMCVDHWLGSLEFWTRRDDPLRYGQLRCEWGYPTAYRQFVANVLHKGHDDIIIPFPNTSTTAAKWFCLADFAADMVYIDGGHEYDDVLADMESWWPLVRSGGVMLGDDWGTFISVPEAVNKFVKDDGLSNHFHVQNNKWVIHKP